MCDRQTSSSSPPLARAKFGLSFRDAYKLVELESPRRELLKGAEFTRWS
jgi:hypothetical protein